MSYQITLTNGYVLTTIPDDAVDTTTSLSLVGHLYPGYGTIIANNFVRLLENAANQMAPPSPLTGQLWYDSTHHLMMVWNGSVWYSVTAVTSVLGNSGDVTLAQMIAGGLAPLNAPVFVGVPTAPTANVGTSNNQIATTAFVVNQVGQLIAGVASVIGLSGNITLAQLTTAGLAPLSSPNFVGLPTGPTAAIGTATTQLATTAFVSNKLQSFITSLSGNAADWDASVAVGQAVYFNTTTMTYQLASATDDTKAPVGLRGANNQLISEGEPYPAGATVFVQGAHYYVDPLNPGNLVVIANNAHVGFATDTATLLVYDLPYLNLTAATAATVYSAVSDATFSLARNDQLPDSKIYRFRASNIAGTPALALSLVNDLGTISTDVLRISRAGVNSVTVDLLTPSVRVIGGNLQIGQGTNNASYLYFINNTGAITGSISQLSSQISFSATQAGTSPMTLSALGNLTIPGQAFASTAALLANNTQLATTAFVYSATRIRCTANLVLYVSPTGNDATGTGSTTLPFATMQYAYNLGQNLYDGAGYTFTIYLMPGTHTSPLTMYGPLTGFQSGLNLTSQSGSYANTIVSVTNVNAISVVWAAVLSVSNFTVQAPVGTTSLVKQTGTGLYLSNGGLCSIGPGMNFGSCGSFHILLQAAASFGCISPYTISGGAGLGHVAAAETSTASFNGYGASPAGMTVTLIGNPGFATAGWGFATSLSSSYVQFLGITWVGTATGLKFVVGNGGYLGVNGAGLNYLPGSLAGTGNALVYGGGYYG